MFVNNGQLVMFLNGLKAYDVPQVFIPPTSSQRILRRASRRAKCHISKTNKLIWDEPQKC